MAGTERPATGDAPATTPGTLLGGRVAYHQPARGYRSGIEPVLLAASIPARPGQRIIEGGSGSGAALLCLATRVMGLKGLGIERDADLVAMARANAARNGLAGLTFAAGDLLATASGPPFDQAPFDHAPFDHAPFDHAMANPPWFDPAAPGSPDPQRDAAKRGERRLLHRWAKALAGRLRHHGTLSFVVRGDALADAMAAFRQADCGSLTIMPLWPRAGRPARIVIVRGVKGGRGGSTVSPGLVLHDDGRKYSEGADRILRHGDAFDGRAAYSSGAG